MVGRISGLIVALLVLLLAALLYLSASFNDDTPGQAAIATTGAIAAELSEKVRVLPKTRLEISHSFAPVVKASSPAVVNVYVHRKVRTLASPFGGGSLFFEFFGREFGIPSERVQRSLGSGVIVSPDGIVVTSHHIIKGTGGKANIKIALADRREYKADILLQDEETDLAVLQIKAPGVKFRYLEFGNSDDLEVGDLVLAIGNPFGVGQTVTSGIVSALARSQVGKSDFQSYIQTDAAINPGNSGGALVGMDGRLVGINTMIFSKSGGSLGIGFAIPTNMVQLVVRQAVLGNSSVERPWFGARLQKVDADIAKSLGLDRPGGALISQVGKNSPAADAGLAAGDVILKVNGHPIHDTRSFGYRFATNGVSGKAKLLFRRGGEIMETEVALAPAPEIPPRDVRRLDGNSPFTGAKVANLSPALAIELAMDETSGVVVVDLARGSPAHRIGLRHGDIILRINDREIVSTGELQRFLTRSQRRWAFSIMRDGQVLETVISL
jgi:Do/DeqQ family serine protease